MKVLKFPHPILTTTAVPVRKINDEFRKTAAEMFELMYESEGVGLAGNQVGLPWRFFVMNPTADPNQKDKEFVFINPVIIKKNGRIESDEGCLSFPDLTLQVVRAETIVFQAINLNGELHKYQWKGFSARIVQHETDHLNGQCFYQASGSTGQIKAEPILKSLQRIYNTDLRMGLIDSEEEIRKEIQSLKDLQK